MGKPEELPPHQEDDGNRLPEDRLMAMNTAYAMPSALATNFPGPGTNASRRPTSSTKKKTMPPLFLYIEAGDYAHAKERARRHPRDVKTWATIKIKSSSVGNEQPDSTKRLALHQACFKVCSVVLFVAIPIEIGMHW